MRGSYIASTFVVLVAALVATDVMACGDKFLVAGRGMRNARNFQATFPASVLVYMNPDADSANVMRDLDLQVTLEMAGHTFKVVETPADLERELASGQYDVLLVDYEDAGKLTAPAARLFYLRATAQFGGQLLRPVECSIDDQ